jgi:hypothetical protein
MINIKTEERYEDKSRIILKKYSVSSRGHSRINMLDNIENGIASAFKGKKSSLHSHYDQYRL